MSNRIPTSTSDHSYISAVVEPAAPDTSGLAQAPRNADRLAVPAPPRMQAPDDPERAAASQLPCLDLCMSRQLISPGDYRRARPGGVSFDDTMAVLESVLADKVEESMQRHDTEAADTIMQAARLIGRTRGDLKTVIIYSKHMLIPG